MRQESLADANDAGISAFKRGDYEASIRYFERALEFSPYNPTIKHNIERARQKLAAQNAPAPADNNSAWSQLNAAAASSGSAAVAAPSSYSGGVGGTGASYHARTGFDTAAQAPSIPLRFTKYLEPSADPVVPSKRRTPKIRSLEQQRDRARAEAKKLETKRIAPGSAETPPEQKKQQAQVIVEQEKTQLQKVQHLDFSISKELGGK